MTEHTSAGAEIRTFLIADVRGYTRFTQTHGDEAAARLAGRFAAIARERVELHGGNLIELRGDEALCVFTSPRAALRAASDIQRQFADQIRADPELPLRVGIGIDAGEPSLWRTATGAARSTLRRGCARSRSRARCW